MKNSPTIRQMMFSSEILRIVSHFLSTNQILLSNDKIFCKKVVCSKNLKQASIFISTNASNENIVVGKPETIRQNKEIDYLLKKEMAKKMNLRFIPNLNWYFEE